MAPASGLTSPLAGERPERRIVKTYSKRPGARPHNRRSRRPAAQQPQPAAAPPAAGRAAEAGRPRRPGGLRPAQCGAEQLHPQSRPALVESKQTIPHFYVTMDFEIAVCSSCARPQREVAQEKGLQALGQRLGHQGRGHALRASPRQLPPMWTDDAILQFRGVDVSVAVARRPASSPPSSARLT